MEIQDFLVPKVTEEDKVLKDYKDSRVISELKV